MKITITTDLLADETATETNATPRNGNVMVKRTSRERADRFLHELFSEHDDLNHLSRSQVQRLIDENLIVVNGKPIKANAYIPPGATIEVTINAPVELEAIPQNIPLQILFEDEHLVVINKQPRLTMHPSETQRDGTLVNALLYHIKDLSGIGGVLRPGIVHRIDKDTSGVIVVTKSDEAHTGLSKLFSTHAIERKYWALSYGQPKWEGSLRLETTLGRNPKDRKKMAVNVEDGRRAVSHFKLLESFGVPGKNPFASLIEATLETGRTHQVRAHLTHLGHSILADRHYGEASSTQAKWKNIPTAVQEAVEQMPGQALHARVLGFKHPITGKDMYFEAEPYPEFAALLAALKKYS